MTFDDHLQRIKIFNRDNWVCQEKNCGKLVVGRNGQIAHLIPQSKEYIDQYGEEIIQHELNKKLVCCLPCNHKVSINGKHKLIEKLVTKIRRRIIKDGKQNRGH